MSSLKTFPADREQKWLLKDEKTKTGVVVVLSLEGTI